MISDMEKIGFEFKLIIAYLIPGVIGLYAASLYIPAIRNVLGGDTFVPSGSAIVLVLVLAIASGIIINAITWAVIRPVIEWTSMKRPDLKYSNLKTGSMDAYNVILEGNYRYYQSYSNMFTSIVLLILTNIYRGDEMQSEVMFLGIVVCIVLFMAARNSLEMTYNEMGDLLKKQMED